MRQNFENHSEIEKTVLGVLLVNANPQIALDILNQLQATDFYLTGHGIIFNEMQKMFLTGAKIDCVLLAEKLISKMPSIGSTLAVMVDSVPLISNYQYYVDIVKRQSKEREFNALVTEAQYREDETSIETKATETIERLNNLVTAPPGEIKTIKELVAPVMKNIEDVHNKLIEPGMFTYFDCIDEFSGGFHAGELTLIAGRPSVGKTTFMLNLLYNISNSGKKCGFISLEMVNQQLIINLLAIHTGVNSFLIRINKLDVYKIGILQTAVTEIENLPIVFSGRRSNDIDDICRTITTMQMKAGIEIIFLDYIQLLSDYSRKSREQEVSSVSLKLANLAKIRNIPIVAGCQLNRLGDELSEPQLSNLRESGALEQNADNVYLLWRETDLNEYIKFRIAKQRCGIVTAPSQLWFDKKHCKIKPYKTEFTHGRSDE